jgi:phosphopantetheine--protein transferase-like protein
VGLDVLSVGRFRAACRAAGTRRRLAARVLAPSERPEAASCLDERILRLAARFSLKEAVSKALGTGLKLGLGLGAAHGVRMHDIHLRIETTGAAVRLLNRALGRLRRLGGGDVAAAWWTDDAYVYAVAVLTPLRRNLSPAPTVVGV